MNNFTEQIAYISFDLFKDKLDYYIDYESFEMYGKFNIDKINKFIESTDINYLEDIAKQLNLIEYHTPVKVYLKLYTDYDDYRNWTEYKVLDEKYFYNIIKLLLK